MEQHVLFLDSITLRKTNVNAVSLTAILTKQGLEHVHAMLDIRRTEPKIRCDVDHVRLDIVP